MYFVNAAFPPDNVKCSFKICHYCFTIFSRWYCIRHLLYEWKQCLRWILIFLIGKYVFPSKNLFSLRKFMASCWMIFSYTLAKKIKSEIDLYELRKWLFAFSGFLMCILLSCFQHFGKYPRRKQFQSKIVRGFAKFSFPFCIKTSAI